MAQPWKRMTVGGVVIAAATGVGVGLTLRDTSPPPAPAPTATATPTVHRLPLVTSNYRDGEPGRTALLSGRLVLMRTGCLLLASPDGHPINTPLVWPDGYKVDTQKGQTVVRNAKGDVVARTGDDIAVTGGTFDGEGQVCGRPGVTAFAIEGPIRHLAAFPPTPVRSPTT